VSSAATAAPPADDPSFFGRSMRRIGALLITISGITPAASVFVMGQDIVHTAGSGAVICFIAAALLGLATAYVYAELGSAFPLTGGEYSIIGRTLGPSCGLMALGLNLVGGATGQAVFALGLADYLKVVVPNVAPLPTALAVTLGTTLVTLLNIRLNAWVTGIFLACELAALAAMSALGFAQPHQPMTGFLLHPVTAADGALAPTTPVALGLGAAAAVFVFNGYGGAVFFGEEMYEARTKLPWVVFTSLAVAVVAEVAPILAVMVGMPDPTRILGADRPLPAFLLATGGGIAEKAISLAVAVSIVNAMIAVGLINARQLYCSGRDKVWPGPLNRWFDAIHPRFRSPWIATLVMGAATAVCCFLGLDLLVMLTGTGIVIIYVGVSLGAIAGRRSGSTHEARYRMPLYPLAPVAALVGLAAVIVANLVDPDVGRPSLIVNGAVMALFAAYYVLHLKRRGGYALRGADGLPLEALEAEGLAAQANAPM
jgi:amino acid transporter